MKRQKEWRLRVSIPLPRPCEGRALPCELNPLEMQMDPLPSSLNKSNIVCHNDSDIVWSWWRSVRRRGGSEAGRLRSWATPSRSSRRCSTPPSVSVASTSDSWAVAASSISPVAAVLAIGSMAFEMHWTCFFDPAVREVRTYLDASPAAPVEIATGTHTCSR
jgi:hypothetical protein